MASNRNPRTEFALSVVAFIAAALPICMLVFGGMAAMKSMGMSMMDMMRTPPTPAMMPKMIHAIHGFMNGYIFLCLGPFGIFGFLATTLYRHSPGTHRVRSHFRCAGGAMGT